MSHLPLIILEGVVTVAVGAALWMAWSAWRAYSGCSDTPVVNTDAVSAQAILQQMNEPRPLPMGQKEFMEWSDRILSGALVPSTDTDSLRAILASMLLNLEGTESHKADAYFIHSLRKAAVNEVAHANFQAIKAKKQAAAEPQKPKVVGSVNFTPG